MSFSHNPHPVPKVPILPQRHPQHISPSHVLGNQESHYPVGTGRRFPREELSPDDLTLRVLNEKSREVRIVLHSPAENVLTPFFQDVPWTTENPRIVHGPNPSIECTGYFQRCYLCIQHSLSRSLPAAVRQKYLKHDHPYVSKQTEGELLLVAKVALDLIEKNYADAYKKMISNAEERTNPPRIFSRTTERTRIVLELRSRRMNVEDMEKILSSPWAKFDEVEVHSSPSLLAVTSEEPNTQPSFRSKSSVEYSRDDAFFFLTGLSGENLQSRTNMMIEKGFSNREFGCNDAPVENNIWNGQTTPAYSTIAKFVPEVRQDCSKCARPQNESGLTREGRNLMSLCPAAERRGSQAMQEHLGIGHVSRVSERDSVQSAIQGRETDSGKLEAHQGREVLMNPNAATRADPGFSLCKRRSSCDAIDPDLHENSRLKRRCIDDPPGFRVSSDPTSNRSTSRPPAVSNSLKLKAPCTCCAESPSSWPKKLSSPTQPVGAPACFDPPNPSVCLKSCCSIMRIGDRDRLDYLPRCQAERFEEILPRNRISAKCPTCGIIFRAIGVAKSAPCVISHSSPLVLLREHMAFHRPNVLNCVFPSCREVNFDNKDDLVAHMDAHRQRLIVAGVEQWENLKAGPLLLPRLSKPHLTCEICLIDFNWRTTLPGMLSHTERYIRHCEQHRTKMGEEDYCVWQCVFRGCETKFASQSLLEEHMWTVHAVLCHCLTCDWIVWGDTDEVCLHREKCTAQLTDVDFKQFGMKSSAKSAPKPSTSGSASTKCLQQQTGTSAKSSRSVSYPSSPLLRRRLKLLRSRAVKSGKPSHAKLDTASSANHLMRFSYYCDYCGAPFRSHHQKQYQSHVQDHLPDKQLTCVYNDCGRKFASVQELHSHVKTKLSTCRYCGAVLFSNYKKHILTCRPLHEIKKQRLLKEEFAKVKYAPMQPEDLYWFDEKLCRSDPGLEQTADVPESDGQECFLRSLNLVKGSFETIKAKTRRHEQLRSQIHVANGKGRRACTEKTACAKCGRIFRNALNLREHLRGYHNARDF